ncbi:hypothetical protein HMPREF0765_0918 [Sphingobacterium spiritivorum ATCC 33300]|uniref:Uncharacterized protein n=1 Tax=Sphingobacterium spiritivorum ATCC 33300 TaxID=525372 RepID=C2FUB2_SPHSI|nr:hypothetical protein HMPREF0765_0918 [Sphingobacterium spiritivorum ATCC 33300]
MNVKAISCITVFANNFSVALGIGAIIAYISKNQKERNNI